MEIGGRPDAKCSFTEKGGVITQKTLYSEEVIAKFVENRSAIDEELLQKWKLGKRKGREMT